MNHDLYFFFYGVATIKKSVEKKENCRMDSDLRWCLSSDTVVAYRLADPQRGTSLTPAVVHMVWDVDPPVNPHRPRTTWHSYFFGRAGIFSNNECALYRLHGIVDDDRQVTVQLRPLDPGQATIRLDGRLVMPHPDSGGSPCFLLRACEPLYMHAMHVIPRSSLTEDRLPTMGLTFAQALGFMNRV